MNLTLSLRERTERIAGDNDATGTDVPADDSPGTRVRARLRMGARAGVHSPASRRTNATAVASFPPHVPFSVVVLVGRLATVGLLASLAAPFAVAGETFDRFEAFFSPRTMRVDYFHTGSKGQEIVSLDRVVADGAWAGSHTRLIDDTNLGKYLFKVIDAATSSMIYSRGFASIYGEWETTAEAGRLSRTFLESLRFPWPRQPVQVVLEKRGSDQAFHEIWSTVIDPASRFVNPADLASPVAPEPLFRSGAPAAKVDIVLLADGYTAGEMDKFRADARRLVDALFDEEPFHSRKSDFNVWLLPLPVPESGVNRPHVGRFRRNPVGTTYNIFDSERYLLTLDNRQLRDALSAAPYEFVEILVNEKQYGGGGIFNSHATTSVDTAFAEYVFIHEFGHHFAALADEYYTSPVAYETGGTTHPEPWEPNVTALLDPARLKWRDLVKKNTPLPTPWDKDAYEEHARDVRRRRQELIDRQAPEAEFDALFRAQQATETPLLAANRHAGQVGAFEGAAYEVTGLYRPTTDCIMFSRNKVGFCPVCRRAIERIIDLYSRP